MKTMKHNYGFTSIELLVWVVLVCICFVGIGVGPSYGRRNIEIPPERYVELKDLASHSCSGMHYLKNRVSSGPILGKDFSEVHARLEEMSVSSERMKIKSSITKSAEQACA